MAKIKEYESPGDLADKKVIALISIGKTEGDYSADEVRKIRAELPTHLQDQFSLRGEIAPAIVRQVQQLRRQADQARMVLNDDCSSAEEIKAARREIKEANEAAASESVAIAAAQNLPVTYRVESFRDLCRHSAEMGDDERNLSPLEKELCDLCLMPHRDLNYGLPWYFPEMVHVLREYHQQWVVEKSKVVVTTLGTKVCDALDFCAASRSLVLLEGNARLGKSFSARAWCEQHPGNARFVEVPPGNDDASFFRALARGLGLGSFLNYKVVEIRERVESVLREGDIVLVMDEG